MKIKAIAFNLIAVGLTSCRSFGWIKRETTVSALPTPAGSTVTVTSWTIDGLIIVAGLLTFAGVVCLVTAWTQGFPSLKAALSMVGAGIAGIALFSLLGTVLFWVKIFIGVAALGAIVWLGYEVYRDKRITKCKK